jgi:hypothetical protein
MSAIYAQVADCMASAAKTAFWLRRASRRLRVARIGIAMSAAIVIPIPDRLISGCKRRANDPSAISPTTRASTKSKIADARCALRSEIGIFGLHCRSTTTAERSSTRLSEPKAIIAGLRAVTDANTEMPSSTNIHARVTLCNHSAVVLGLEGREKAGCNGEAPSCISSDILLHSSFQACRRKARTPSNRASCARHASVE